MALVTYITFVGLLGFTLGDAEECVINSTPVEIRWEKKLAKDLRCNYQTYLPPKLNNSEPVPVTISMILKYFSFSSHKEELSLQTWVFISWIDERLQWDREKYGGIDNINVYSFIIWTPLLRLYNSVDSSDFDIFYLDECELSSFGLVMCARRVTHTVRCSVKLDNFPYDAQECHFIYGPWNLDYKSFILKSSSKAMYMWGAGYGSQWMISDYKQSDSEKFLNITLVLERESLSLAGVILYPSLIISALTVACLFLDVRENLRLALVCFSIFSHYYWLMELGENIPKEGTDPPTLLMYYRGSLAVTVFMFIVTSVLAVVSRKETTPHTIVLTLNGYVYGSYARFLILPKWDSDVEDLDGNEFKEDWNKFANGANSVCAIIVFVVYVGLYCTFMPQPLPIN